ncbi:MAG: hypothetical protein ACI8TQ_000629 [Planctomycetota bacterium]
MDARKTRIGPDELEELFADSSRILVSKGKKTIVVDLKKDAPDAEELSALVLGRSGNLKAPSIRMGKTWIVGYGDVTWTEHFD